MKQIFAVLIISVSMYMISVGITMLPDDAKETFKRVADGLREIAETIDLL